MSQILKLTSAFTLSLLVSLRFVIALDLALLQLWVMAELTYSVFQSSYPSLAILFAATLLTTLVVTIWRCVKPQDFGVTVAYSSGLSLNILPLSVLDVVVVSAVVFVADLLHKPLTTPVLHFCQTMLQTLMG
jgi:hypothetical protein